MEKELVSVIIPIYNVERYLQRCLSSLEEQSYKNIEVLMVDDGSTDGCGEIAKAFAERDKRFIYLYQHNAGQGSARNTGMQHSTGEYYCFVDSDDYVSPYYVEYLLKGLHSAKADIAVCKVERFFDSGRRCKHKITNNECSKSETTDIKNYLLNASFSIWNKIYKRQLFDGLSFPAKMKFEDFALIPQVYARAKKIVSISETLYYYYFRRNSTTTGQKVNLDILKAQHLLEDSEFAKYNADALKVYFVRMVMGSLLWAMMQDCLYSSKVKDIIKEGKDKYPELEAFIHEKYIGVGKTIWGKLILNEHFKMAKIYIKVYEQLRKIRLGGVNAMIVISRKIK